MKNCNFHSAILASSLLACALLTLTSNLQAERLPQTVRPEHYTLAFTPDLKAATFTGVETIDVSLAEPTDRITLNAIELDLKSVTVTVGDKQQTGAGAGTAGPVTRVG